MVFVMLLQNGQKITCPYATRICLWILIYLHKKIECGVLHGSILGPILFLLCINDILNICSIPQSLVHTDDASILYRDSDLNSLVNVVNQEMQKNNEWFASNKLNINVGKITAMLFHPCQTIIYTDDNMIKINYTTVPFSIFTKLLGICIDNDLTWNAHIKHVNKKFNMECVFFPVIEMNYRIKFSSSLMIN